MSTASAGAVNGNATIAFVSDASNVGNCAPNCQLNLAFAEPAVSGAVYRLANPLITTGPIALAARVGDAAPSATIGVTNSSPDIYTERLNAGIGPGPSGFNTSGNITGLAAQASSSALGVSLNTAAAGNFGGQVALSFVSSGTGTTGAPDAGPGCTERQRVRHRVHPGRGTAEHPGGQFRHRAQRRCGRGEERFGDQRRRRGCAQ